MVARRQLLTRSGAALVAVLTAQILSDQASAARVDGAWGVIRSRAADSLRVAFANGAEVELRITRPDTRTQRDGAPGLTAFLVGDEVVLEVRDGTALLWMQSSYRAFCGLVESVGARLVTSGGSARLDGRTRIGRKVGPMAASSLRPGQHVVVNALLDPASNDLIARSVTVED